GSATLNLPPRIWPPAVRSSTQVRALPARNLGQSCFSVSTGIGLTSPERLTAGDPGAPPITAPDTAIFAAPARMTKLESVTLPSLGDRLPVAVHSSILVGPSPNSSTPSTASSARMAKFQETTLLCSLRTGVNVPLKVAWLFPQR